MFEKTGDMDQSADDTTPIPVLPTFEMATSHENQLWSKRLSSARTELMGPEELRRLKRAWPRILIGRSPQADICLEAPQISAHHCELVPSDDGFDLLDLDSTNGTYINSRHNVAAPHVPLAVRLEQLATSIYARSRASHPRSRFRSRVVSRVGEYPRDISRLLTRKCR